MQDKISNFNTLSTPQFAYSSFLNASSDCISTEQGWLKKKTENKRNQYSSNGLTYGVKASESEPIGDIINNVHNNTFNA